MEAVKTNVMPPREKNADFEAFFEREYGRLFRAMWLMTGNRWEGEELAQEAMARAYERWDRVQSAMNPSGYVHAIALNLNRNRLRRGLMALRRGGVDPPTSDPLAQAETREEVFRAINRLPRTQREALVLVEWLGLTPEEASQVLGIKAVSVRGRVHRARLAFKSNLGERDA